MNFRTVFLSWKGLVIAVLPILVIVALSFPYEDSAHSDIKKDALVASDKTLEYQSSDLEMTPSIIPGIEKKQDSFDFDEAMKLKLKAISEAYREEAKYPSFSVPIKADELTTKYKPDMPIATELPADMSQSGGPSLSILPGKFRYFSGDELTATARINGLSKEEISDVSARLVMQGNTLGTATVSESEAQAHEYHLVFDSLALVEIEWKENITMEVEFRLPGGIYTRSVTIEYLNTIAKINDTSASEVQGEYLLIPVYVETEKPGFHRLQANLYETATDKPLVHLIAEDQITSTSGMLTLRAHISALKAAGSEGPYQLKDLMLRRLPSEPDYITEFGRIEQSAFDVQGYSFSRYEDQPYINEKAQRIANELRKLGS